MEIELKELKPYLEKAREETTFLLETIKHDTEVI